MVTERSTHGCAVAVLWLRLAVKPDELRGEAEAAMAEEEKGRLEGPAARILWHWRARMALFDGLRGIIIFLEEDDSQEESGKGTGGEKEDTINESE